MKTRKTFKIQYSNRSDSSGLSINNKQKFDLYLRARKMANIHELFLGVANYSDSQRQRWLDDNKDYVLQIFETFVEDTMLAMNGLHMDDELKRLSMRLITSIRDTTVIIRNILKVDVPDVLN